MSVAVLMTCFNEGPYITDAVKSVLAQTAADRIDHIVIMDDGSEAETVEVLRALERLDPRIDIQYGKGGAGLPLNRNIAASRVTSKYLAILDGDDLWAPAKLQKQFEAMEADPEVGLTYTGYFLFSDNEPSKALAVKVFDLARRRDLTLAYFLNDPPIMPSSVMMRRDRFEQAGLFDPTVKVFEDTEFYLRLSRVCRFAAVSEPLIYKRNRASSITGQRGNLMGHHAFVAFKAAAQDRRLLPLVPKRLAQRARKLGNVYYYAGDLAAARQMYALAARLDPLSGLAWGALLLATFGAGPAQKLLRNRHRARAAAFG